MNNTEMEISTKEPIKFANESKREIDRILRKIVKSMTVYSDEVPSNRIEGQFGWETTESKFSNIFIYVKYSSQLIKDYEIIKYIILNCHNRSSIISRERALQYIVFLFNDENNGFATIHSQLRFASNFIEQKNYEDMINNFKANKDNDVLYMLNKGSLKITDNSLLVFITDTKGCVLSSELSIKYRKLKNQSLTFYINDETVKIKVGLPEIAKEEQSI